MVPGLTHGAGTWTVTADTYVVEVGRQPPRAVVADRAGRIWSQLSLLASVDRVDQPDESFALEVPVVEVVGAAVQVCVVARSTAWDVRRVVLRCLADRIEVTVQVEGEGVLGEARLLGGRAVLADGAAGMFRSSVDFGSVFVPAPAEPVRLVRPPGASAVLGVLGDARAGRVHALFSPPPLCLALGRASPTGALDVPAGDWLSLAVVAPVTALRFTELRYDALDDGFLVALDYDGHTRVRGTFETPPLVLRPVPDPWTALDRYRQDLVDAGYAPAGPSGPAPAWWHEPMFCGWGAQCARAALPGEPSLHPRRLPDLPPALLPAGTTVPSDLSRADVYDDLLDRLARHGVVPGTVVVDDRWQRACGTGEVDTDRWPDLASWVAARHAAGQRVLLWWKAWDPTGLPARECLRDPSGRPVAVDVGSTAYLRRLDGVVGHLLGPDGVDADGLKVDFTQRSPAGALLRGDGDLDAPWGVAALHVLLRRLYVAARRAKPDALVVTHTPHPSFGDVCDMVRLDDILERDAQGRAVPAVEQARSRRAIVAAVLPGHLVDTDQWPVADLVQWRAYVTEQGSWGVPALYYAERLDRSGDELGDADLALVAAAWAGYRERVHRSVVPPRSGS
ncbi:hypothetical protein [Cellulomonas sp. URHB0016]